MPTIRCWSKPSTLSRVLFKSLVAVGRRLPITLIALILCLGGCGGGGGGGDKKPSTTQARVTINWPERTRSAALPTGQGRDVAAPNSALSASIRLTPNSGAEAVWYVQRNSVNLNAYTDVQIAPSDSLSPVGQPLTMTITFYAEPTAPGATTVVGTASAQVTLDESGNGIGAVMVQGKVTQVQALPNQSLNVGETKDLNFSALDAGGNLVAVSPGSARWQVVSGAEKLSVSPGGSATGLAKSDVVVTATVDGKVSPNQTVTVMEHGYGATLASKAEVDQRPAALNLYASAQGEQLPAAVDLTTKTALPKPGDQGQQGSCTAWAIGYGLTSFAVATAKNGDSLTADHEASPTDLYAKSLRAMNSYDCDGGAYMKTVMEQVSYPGPGVATLSQVPYDYTNCTSPSSFSTFRIKGYHAVKASDPVAIKRELAAGNPLAFGMKVLSDFQMWGFGPDRRGVYQGSGYETGSAHALLLVGYDDSKSAWKVMNSWGKSFGDDGYFWMSYDAFTRTVYEMFVADGGGSDNNPTPDPTPSPDADPTFRSLSALQTYDYYYGYSYLILNYDLSEPIYATTVSIGYPSGGVGKAQFNQWIWSSYVWAYLAFPASFEDGQYTLTIEGITSSGKAVTVSATTTLNSRSRAIPQGLRGSLGRATLPPMPANLTPIKLTPGSVVGMNGRKVTLTSQ